MTEKELQQGIIEAARIFGWRIAHFRSVPVKRGNQVRWETPVQADGKGFPDLVLVRERVVFAELKAAGRKMAAAQYEWLKALHAAGAEAYLWVEDHWTSGQVESILRARFPSTKNPSLFLADEGPPDVHTLFEDVATIERRSPPPCR